MILRKKTFFLAIALVFVSGAILFYTAQTKRTTLCIEVGHTRIKAAILPQKPTLQGLKNSKTFAYPSKPWLQQNLEKLFQKNRASPLYALLHKNPSAISLSIFGPIYDHSRYDLGKPHSIVPVNLKEVLEKELGRELHIESDSVSWAIGALEYLKLHSEKLPLPSLAITLGTGIGVALIENANSVVAIELWAKPIPLPRLELLTDKRPAHRVFGKKYLDTLFKGEEFVDEGMISYSRTYNQQLMACIEDLSAYLSDLFSIPISSVIIGGGYSRFIDLSSEEREIRLLHPQKLSQEGLSPDIIQLLGCLRQAQKDPLHTWTYPPLRKIAVQDK